MKRVREREQGNDLLDLRGGIYHPGLQLHEGLHMSKARNFQRHHRKKKLATRHGAGENSGAQARTARLASSAMGDGGAGPRTLEVSSDRIEGASREEARDAALASC